MSKALIIHAHNDDIPLWCSFSALAHDQVDAWTMLDSYVQPSRGMAWCDAETRRTEDRNAANYLNIDLKFAGFRDDAPDWDGIRMFLLAMWSMKAYDTVYVPAVEVGGHNHHNELGKIAHSIWSDATQVLSYTKAGKSVSDHAVPFQDGWIAKKLRALACYESQMRVDPRQGCWPHFLRSQMEYYR